MNSRFLGSLLVSASLLLLAVGVPEARAQGGDLKLVSGADFEYGVRVRFTLSTDRPARVRQVWLHFHRSDSPQLIIRSGEAVADGTAGRYEVVVDLAKEPLPPYSTFISWWRVETSDGETAFSPKVSFVYFDNRKEWVNLKDPPLAVSWTGMEPEWGERVGASARRNLETIRSTLGLPSPALLSIFVYPSTEALRDGLLSTDASFAADYAAPAPGVLLVAATGDLMSPAQLDRTVGRALTEALLYHATGERYSNVPSWFREGLGTLVEPGFESSIDPLLQEAMESNRLPKLHVLCLEGDTPASIEVLRSAQAASVLQYALMEYGQDGLLRTLSAYAEGASCEGGVKLGLGRSLDQLEMEWLAARFPGAMVRRLGIRLSPWLLLLAPVFLLVVLSYLANWKGGPFGRLRRPSRDVETEEGSENHG